MVNHLLRNVSVAAVALLTALTLVVTSSSQAVAAPTPALHYPAFDTAGPATTINATFPLPTSAPLTASIISTKNLRTADSVTLPGDRGFGAIYGPSDGFSYLRVNSVDTTTTITFSPEVPAGEMGIALGDIDAEELVISMISQSGVVTSAQMGVQAPFNYTSSDTSLPTIIRDDTTTITVLEPGCPDEGKCDTAGATVWFTPTVPVSVITIESTRRPTVISAEYQLWLASGAAQVVSWAPTVTEFDVSDLPATPDPATVTLPAPPLDTGTISYSVAPSSTSDCTVNSTTAEISATTAGTCVIQAVAAATDDFLAGSTKATFTITAPPPPAPEPEPEPEPTPAPAPKPEPTKPPTPTEWTPGTTNFQVTTFPGVIELPPPPPPPGGGAYTFTADTASTSLCTVDRDTPTITVPQPGTCSVTASVGETKNFSKASVTVTFTITGGPTLAATGAPAWPLWPVAAGLVGLAMVAMSRAFTTREH